FLNSLHKASSLNPKPLVQLVFKGRVARGGHGELVHCFLLRLGEAKFAMWSLFGALAPASRRDDAQRSRSRQSVPRPTRRRARCEASAPRGSGAAARAQRAACARNANRSAASSVRPKALNGGSAPSRIKI